MKKTFLKKAVSALILSLFFTPVLPIQAQEGYDGLGPVVLSGGQRDMQWPVPNYPNIQSCFYDHRDHKAIDIAAPQGTPVVAAYPGTVVEVFSGGTGSKTGYGNYVVVQHSYPTANGNVTLYTRYNHLYATQASVGQSVSRGQTIGLVGMTGYAEGNHLDFQVYKGAWNNKGNSIDPFSNQLLELPGGIVVYDSWNCGPDYLNQVRNLYSTPVTPIYQDTKSPVISNIKVTQDSKGYTITCTVEDESGIDKVLFPTWTPYNGQDDLGDNWPANPAYVGKLEGNKATFRVNISDHNNELGTYITDIYAFDTKGNGIFERVVVDMDSLDTKNPVVSNIQVSTDEKGYTITCTVEDESGIDKVLFPTWTPYNGQDDLGDNWPANPAYVGKLEGNKATFRVNISDHNNELGTYITDIYAFDTKGNGVCERVVVDMNEATKKKLTMYRLYNPNSREHFYTASSQEKNHLASIGWIYEGIGWYAPEKSDKPVYRLYHPGVGDHHYTMDKNEVDFLTAYVGWKNEGVGWYSADSSGQPIYRQFAPFLKTGSHNYTTDPNERDTLISLGWENEGIAWYGLK